MLRLAKDNLMAAQKMTHRFRRNEDASLLSQILGEALKRPPGVGSPQAARSPPHAGEELFVGGFGCFCWDSGSGSIRQSIDPLCTMAFEPTSDGLIILADNRSDARSTHLPSQLWTTMSACRIQSAGPCRLPANFRTHRSSRSS